MNITKENLEDAFAGESQARNKYTYFSQAAKKEGYHYIAKLFEETAENEKRHAKDILNLLNGIGDTATNLKDCIAGEHYETAEMYPQFVREAEKENNKEAAYLFAQISKVEAHHRDRFKKLLKMVENKTVFKREEPIEWKCSVCGYILKGTEPPATCPCCQHPKEYYEPANLNL